MSPSPSRTWGSRLVRWLALAMFLAQLLDQARAAPLSIASRRKEDLQELLRLLPKSESWEAWLRNSGELPPDFAGMKSQPFLPEPLRFEDGKIVSRESWPLRRRELLLQFQYYLLGTMPVSPGNVEAVQTQSQEQTASFIQDVVLGFGPNHAARLYLQLIVPEGEGPFPVFVAPLDQRPWALVAVSRGYIGCLYAAGETRDDTSLWPSLWPDYDWSQLTRRAWAASRCLDYLHQIDAVDTNRIAIAGHGPNGKVALIAAALDLRIDAVVSSSSGAGGACPFRLFSGTEWGETIELLTRNHPTWFHPRLRFFSGRESRLPVDQPQLIACIAPRPCLLSSSLQDPGEHIWAVEQTVHSARRVYGLFQQEAALTLQYRSGGSAAQAPQVETFLDWLDTVFGRGFFPFPSPLLFPTYETWLDLVPETADPQSFPTNHLSDFRHLPNGQPLDTPAAWSNYREVLRDKIFAALGEPPPFATTPATLPRGRAGSHPAPFNPDLAPAGLAQQRVNFGNDIPGDLFFPLGAQQARHTFSALVWLHPFSAAAGYVPAQQQGLPPHLLMAQRGFVVLAYDQIGNGARLEEVQYFYHRYPRWSLLGKQIDDALAAVDALLQMDFVNPGRIYLIGYGLGARVALLAAALDNRIAGVGAVAGFTPMRSDSISKETGGLARWSRWFPFHPQLGPFLGEENRLPYDYHEVLALVAPRPTLLFVPRLDEQSDLVDIKGCVQTASEVFELLGQKTNLQLQVLDDFNRFSPQSQRLVFERLAQVAGARVTTPP